ncbi:MAG: serine hydrolase [Methylococcales bacterium]|nr:serine hydrolase [Methylococcales bacterium]
MNRRKFLLFSTLSLLMPKVGYSKSKNTLSLEHQINETVLKLRRSGLISKSDKTSWSVYDFSTSKKLVSINEDISRQCASMVKPIVALAFFKLVSLRKLTYGTMSKKKMRRMLVRSDNRATNWVMKRCGGPRGVQKIINKYYSHIFFDTKIVEYIPTRAGVDGRTYKNKASAHDYSRFLFALWNKKLPDSKELMKVMGMKNKDYVFHGVPSIPLGTKIIDKTGTTSMLCGNISIIKARGKNGKTYPYTMIGIIESPVRKNNYSLWRKNSGKVIREVSGVVYQSMKKSHNLV